MMLRQVTRLIIALMLVPTWLAGADQDLVGAEFDSKSWPGQVSSAQMRNLEPRTRELEEAIQAEDEARILSAVDAVKEGLGDFVGVPESRPEYGSPIDDSTPDLERVTALWLASYERMKDRHGWDTASLRNAKFQEGSRLRVSLRHARAYLQSYEAGLEPADEFQGHARSGFDYIVGAQSSQNGVFGYPYHLGGPGLKQQAAQIVQRALKSGHPLEEMVENGWVINVYNMGGGGLQFDNGMCGIGLLYAYAVSADERYLNAARRAGDWAAEQNLVGNWNYNCFSGHLLARLYRVTGEQRYLNAAHTKFELGVLPGLMENGRWVDPHNAKIQYHSVMVRSLIDYYLALEQAEDDSAEPIKAKIEVALDNVSEQITSYGASNFYELLSLDALCLGLMTFGHRNNWERAVNVNVNYLADHAVSELEARGMPMTETIANYLLYRASVADSVVKAREILPKLGLGN